MSGTGNASVDVQRMLSLDAGALEKLRCGCRDHGSEGCCSCCCGPHPFPWAGPSDGAIREREVHLKKLIPAAKALLAAAQGALAEGATTAAEIRDVQRLEIWLGRLFVEEERYRKPPKK